MAKTPAPKLTRYLRPRPSLWILAILPTMTPMRLGCCCAAVVPAAAAADDEGAAVVMPVPPPAGPSLVPRGAWLLLALASFAAASDDRSAPPGAPRRAADAILPNMMAGVEGGGRFQSLRALGGYRIIMTMTRRKSNNVRIQLRIDTRQVAENEPDEQK